MEERIMTYHRTLIITKGLPGSGKTTWAKKYILEHKNTVIVCRDDIRRMLKKDNTDGANDFNESLLGIEPLARAIRNAMIITAFNAEYDVIANDTGLNSETINHLYEICENFIRTSGISVNVEIKDFTSVPVDVCVERDSKRKKPIGADTIYKIYTAWQSHIKE